MARLEQPTRPAHGCGGVSNLPPTSLRAALPAGTELDFLGDRATVVADNGGPSILVQSEGGNQQEWMWEFEGEKCKVISAPLAGRAVALGRWASIASAPRDETRVLLFRTEYDDDRAVGWWSQSDGSWTAVSGNAFPGVTHWMPLPDGPIAAGGDD